MKGRPSVTQSGIRLALASIILGAGIGLLLGWFPIWWAVYQDEHWYEFCGGLAGA